MSEKPTRTVRKKEYRAKHKARYHRCSFIAEYTQKKYGHIYEEANSFYNKLFKRYPTKTKLTTCVEYKIWETEIEKNHGPATQTAPVSICSATTTSTDDRSSTTPDNLCSADNIRLNIQLMDTNEVNETRDTLMFQHIYPSILEEINPKTVDQIITEIWESTGNIEVMDSSQIRESDANIPPMDLNQVEETQGTPALQNVHSPFPKELNLETLDQIINEIEKSEVNVFNYDPDYDQDINDVLNMEINNHINELSALEKELLRY